MEEENIPLKKTRKFQVKQYIGCVITPVQSASREDILITRICALHELARIARI